MKSYQPLSCLFSELWTAPRFQVSPRLRKVEGRDQPRGQSLSPEASQEEWWPFWSPERAISSAFQQNVSISRYFFQTILPRRFFLVRPTCFRLEWNLNLFWWCTCCFFYQRKETKKRRYFRCAWNSPLESQIFQYTILKRVQFFGFGVCTSKRQKNWPSWRRWILFVSKNNVFRASSFILSMFHFFFHPFNFSTWEWSNPDASKYGSILLFLVTIWPPKW